MKKTEKVNKQKWKWTKGKKLKNVRTYKSMAKNKQISEILFKKYNLNESEKKTKDWKNTKMKVNKEGKTPQKNKKQNKQNKAGERQTNE